ncbi:MAG: ABC transporter permease subunit [Spirochaetaceae bacterium]|nr:ABC transporter permease subunit [Spirochaetaceae bacterium]
MRSAVAPTEIPVQGAGTQSVWQRQARKIRASKYLLLLVLPGFVWYVIFQYIPMYGVTIAFKELSLRLGVLGSPWIGFDQFERFFRYPHFWRLIRNTFLLNFYTMLFGFPAPIIFALALNELVNRTYKRTVQTVSFLPHFIAMPAVVGMLVLALSPSTGFVNAILAAFGVEPIYFMIKPRWFRPIYVISDIWQNVGWGAILYLAQLSRVDPELYEAATVDGASRLRKMWHISLPALTPVISILLILRIGGLLSVGGEKVLLMYNDLTIETADVIWTYVYRRGLLRQDFSYGTAVGLFHAVISLVLVVLANTAAKRFSEYRLW